jgi:hypothetical protein
MVKPYCQKFTDFVEVNIYIAGVLPEHAYKLELSGDGLSMILRRAIPDFFFESKRMVSMLKSAYQPDESHVIAHDNVVQQIWKGGMENKGQHFAAEEDVMIIQLGVVCTGTVRVKETLQKVDKVIHGNHTHFQFNTIYSCKVQVIVQRTLQKKKMNQAVHVDVNKASEEEDTNGEDNDGDKKIPKKLEVGLRLVRLRIYV